MRSAPYFHNMIGILTETQHNSADPVTYDASRFPRTFADGTSTSEPSTFYPHPFRGGEWHLEDSCDYNMSATLALLDLAAKRKEEWLYDIYRMGRDAIRAGEGETWIVPAEQWDAGAAWRMVNAFRWGGVQVERATEPFTVDGRTYAAGSFLIRGAQPFRQHIVDLLTPQVYPDRRIYPGGPLERPYDISGWTLSFQMGVDVQRVRSTVNAITPGTGTESRVQTIARELGLQVGVLDAAPSYASKDFLRSGWLLGERVVAGRAAIVEASIEKGRVVPLGFRVQHRGQAHGTFKLLFNSLYLGASERAPAGTAAGE